MMVVTTNINGRRNAMKGFAEQSREQRLIYATRDPDTLDLNSCSAAAALADGAW